MKTKSFLFLFMILTELGIGSLGIAHGSEFRPLFKGDPDEICQNVFARFYLVGNPHEKAGQITYVRPQNMTHSALLEDFPKFPCHAWIDLFLREALHHALTQIEGGQEIDEDLYCSGLPRSGFPDTDVGETLWRVANAKQSNVEKRIWTEGNQALKSYAQAWYGFLRIAQDLERSSIGAAQGLNTASESRSRLRLLSLQSTVLENEIRRQRKKVQEVFKGFMNEIIDPTSSKESHEENYETYFYHWLGEMDFPSYNNFYLSFKDRTDPEQFGLFMKAFYWREVESREKEEAEKIKASDMKLENEKEEKEEDKTLPKGFILKSSSFVPERHDLTIAEGASAKIEDLERSAGFLKEVTHLKWGKEATLTLREGGLMPEEYSAYEIYDFSTLFPNLTEVVFDENTKGSQDWESINVHRLVDIFTRVGWNFKNISALNSINFEVLLKETTYENWESQLQLRIILQDALKNACISNGLRLSTLKKEEGKEAITVTVRITKKIS